MLVDYEWVDVFVWRCSMLLMWVCIVCISVSDLVMCCVVGDGVLLVWCVCVWKNWCV